MAKLFIYQLQYNPMAKYSKKAQDKVEEAMHEYKTGKLKSGPGGKAGKVKNPKQAIAIGLSEARKEGAKVPKKKEAKVKAGKTNRIKATVNKAPKKKSTAKK
jgi:hypothetical protein